MLPHIKWTCLEKEWGNLLIKMFYRNFKNHFGAYSQTIFARIKQNELFVLWDGVASNNQNEECSYVQGTMFICNKWAIEQHILDTYAKKQ